MQPLCGIHVVTLALNLPGPLAAAQLQRLGASVTKIEPPGGDQLAQASPGWYQALHQGQTILTLDLKAPSDRQRLEDQLLQADLLLTAMRPAALQRLQLDWPILHRRHPRLCHVAIMGYPPPDEDQPGHDLTYQARAGLLQPPQLPRTCLADFAGAQQAVSMALALLLARERGQEAQFASVSLAEAAEDWNAPWHYGLTSPGGILGGGHAGHAGYDLYPAREGWIALAALEPVFWKQLLKELRLTSADRNQLEQIFQQSAAEEWEKWAMARGVPLAAVREK